MVILGALAGVIASAVMASSNGILMDIILGIVGAVVGGFVMSFFGQPGVTGLDIYSLVVATIGAVIVIALGRMLTRGTTRAAY